MAFGVQDYIELVRLLQEHPEWRAELRRLLLTDELLALPEIVRELVEAQRRTERQVERLAEAQRRTEERLGRVEEQIGTLAEAQRRTEERVGRVEEQIAALADAQRRTEERVGRVEEQIAALADAQRQAAEMIRALAEDQRRINDRLSSLDGHVLELTYRDKAGAYFGPLLRGLRVVEPHTLEDRLEARLRPDELKDLLRLDLLVRGRPRHQPDAPEVWLAVEISSVIDRGDVERARRRAYLLRKAGYRAIPTVAGRELTQGAEDQTKEHRVLIVKDGSATYWDEALQTWTAPKAWEQFDAEP